MARYAVIENNKCINIAEADSALENFVLLNDGDNVSYGDTYDPATQTWTKASLREQLQLTDKDIVEMAKQELIRTDWTQLPDVGLTAENVAQWQVYRVGLREIKDGSRTFEDWPQTPNTEYV